MLYSVALLHSTYFGVSMLDTLIFNIPMLPEFVRQTGNLYSVIGDVADYQIKAVPSYLKRDLMTGKVTYGDLRHPYESLPSSYSGMAIKFNAVNVANTLPYISLNASTKILQGHNVFGGESVLNLASEMLHLLQSNYPEFFACLDLSNASISRIDSTYSVRLPHQRLIQPCLRFLSNVSNGQRRNDTDRRDFFNTVYWGGATTRYGNAVAYGKHEDVMREVKELQSKSKKGCLASASKLSIFTPELLEWSSCLLRFESRTKKRKLEQLGFPINLWAFIAYQEKNKDVLAKLWRGWFDPILNSLEGTVMDNYDDSSIYDLCRRKLVTFNRELKHSFINPYYLRVYSFQDKIFVKTGKKSYTKANNAFNFYQLLKLNTFSDVRNRYSKAQFSRLVKSLVDIDIPKAHLQNLGDTERRSIPMIELVKFDFSNQYPADYTPPISSHIKQFKRYVRAESGLKMVS